MKKHIGIIGGGAAGMMAAVTAARKGTKVTILERNDRIGKKILQTGNGKCNLGNRNLTVECYHGGDAAWIKQALERLLFSKNRASDQGKKRISVSGQ